MKNLQAFPNPHRTDQTGMTMQQYAAIKLKVPDSGVDWLDEMIRQSLKDDFAAKAMQGMMHDVSQPVGEVIAEWAYQVADAMLKAREA
jgi:hypothetical protein